MGKKRPPFQKKEKPEFVRSSRRRTKAKGPLVNFSAVSLAKTAQAAHLLTERAQCRKGRCRVFIS